VRRDLALVVPEAVDYASLDRCVVAAAGILLRELRLFDVYRGAGIETGCKSFAIGLILQDDSRTLSDVDVDRLVAAVVERAAAELGAQVRS
jgi:phenylalanyl-tRNA synthetase beta chain